MHACIAYSIQKQLMLEWFGVKLLSFDSVFGLESESNCERKIQGDGRKKQQTKENNIKHIKNMHTIPIIQICILCTPCVDGAYSQFLLVFILVLCVLVFFPCVY